MLALALRSVVKTLGLSTVVGADARAIVASPDVILADEPTGNLHSSQGREIMELFNRLNEGGTTIVQVTHSEANAAFGSRVIQLCDGFMQDRTIADLKEPQ
jgi:putative ABC transport system ATP-binding protein